MRPRCADCSKDVGRYFYLTAIVPDIPDGDLVYVLCTDCVTNPADPRVMGVEAGKVQP